MSGNPIKGRSILRGVRGRATTLRAPRSLKEWYEGLSNEIRDKNVSVTARRGLLAGMQPFEELFRLNEKKDGTVGSRVGMPF